jgi:hypothetical protein
MKKQMSTGLSREGAKKNSQDLSRSQVSGNGGGFVRTQTDKKTYEQAGEGHQEKAEA